MQDACVGRQAPFARGPALHVREQGTAREKARNLSSILSHTLTFPPASGTIRGPTYWKENHGL